MSTSALSKANKETILQVLRAHGPMSRTQIAQATGLSMATASRLVTTLLEENLLLRSGSVANTGGRPSLMVCFNDAAAVTLAINIKGSETDVALVDLGAGVLHRECHPGAPTVPERIRQTIHLAEKAIAVAAERNYRCVAAGVSVPGPVSDEGTVDFAPALGWHQVALGAMLEQHLALPTVVENDANLIALAEYRHGEAAGVASLVAVAVFQGIGSGIIEKGRIWHGGHGASGQLGRMLLDTNALQHVYSGFGDLESRLGASGIARRAAERGIAQGDEGLVLHTILQRQQRGDAAATSFLDEIFDEFAMSLANVCALLDPECIVFAGLFAEWSHVVIPELSRRLVGHVLHLPLLIAASTDLDAALVGAADTAFDRFGSVTNLL